MIVEGIGDITNGLIQSVYQIPTCLCYHSWNYHAAFLLKDEILYNNPRFVNGRLADYFGLTIFDSHLGNHLKWSVLKNNEFVCVNDSIDFPKKIKYWTDGEKIKAKISNEEMEIPFEFSWIVEPEYDHEADSPSAYRSHVLRP